MTAVYHITHVSNLGSILIQDGLCCDNRRIRLGLTCRGIAYEHIKARRAQRSVPVCRHGTLADYVPFYFAPRSPMLYAIYSGSVPSYADGQRPVLHLVASAEAIARGGLSYAFTDGHADMGYSTFFDDLGDLSHVDWSIMQEKYWHDTLEDGDRKRRRQAEFLVYDYVPWSYVEEIGVIDQATAATVQGIIRSAAHVPRVQIHRNWYY